MARLTEAKRNRIQQLIEMGTSIREIMRLEKVSDRTVTNIRKEFKIAKPQEGDSVATVYGEQTGSLDVHTSYPKNRPPRWLDIKNPEQLLEHCDVDTAVWMVDTCRVSSSEVTMKLRSQDADEPVTYTNVHVSVRLKRRSVGEQALEGMVGRLLSGPYKPKAVKYRTPKDGVLLEWCPYDHHHGLLAWAQEVDADWDLKISADFFDRACEDVLHKASMFNVSQIVVPIGQDWFHCDDPSYQTPAGKHRLDIEGRLIKVFETGYWSLFRGIERLRQVAPVHLLWIPGNHDPQTSYYLARTLAAHYMDTDGEFRCGVTVDCTPRSRKVYSWGNSCIGFSHPMTRGQWERQRGIFAETFKAEWAKAIHHEIHTGHLHKVMEYEYMQADTIGSHTVVRMLPSLCASDKWHWENGWLDKNRASASFIWHPTDGLVCQFTTRVLANDGRVNVRKGNPHPRDLAKKRSTQQRACDQLFKKGS